jgi:hypothetical protein
MIPTWTELVTFAADVRAHSVDPSNFLMIASVLAWCGIGLIYLQPSPRRD